jgi:hypothetical protein
MSYKNPPKEKQFKKGKSGNADGRPRQAAQLLPRGYLFRKVAFEEVEIGVDGAPIVMTRWEAMVRQVHIMAHKNLSAARLLHRIRTQFPGESPTTMKPILVLSDNQMKY